MTIGIDGMVSGLDTTAIINGLVAIQANQQVLLKRKSSAASDLITALQGLNTRVSSLATAATKVADPSSWAVTKASSSATGTTVSAGPSARPGTVEFNVDRLATRQVTLISDPSVLTEGFTITVGNGDDAVDHQFTGGEHIDDITAAINDLTGTTGISATKVRTGTDTSTGDPVYSLQLSGATGAANAFAVTADGSGDTVGTAVAAAQDAQITLWPSVGGDFQLTSSSNTFTGVLEGVDVTVRELTGDDGTPVTVTVTTDTAAQRKLAADLVSNVGVVLSEIASRTRTTTSTNGAGDTVVTGGVLSGDSAIRFLTSDLQSAMTSPVNGRSPSTIGISMDRAGAISLDESAFADALAEDPEGTMAMLQSIAARVGEVATTASDANEGTLTRKITSQESIVKDLGDQITRWDTRLEARRNQLIAQFSAMEVRLAQLESTQSWLTNQLTGLNALNSARRDN